MHVVWENLIRPTRRAAKTKNLRNSEISRSFGKTLFPPPPTSRRRGGAAGVSIQEEEEKLLHDLIRLKLGSDCGHFLAEDVFSCGEIGGRKAPTSPTTFMRQGKNN